MDKEFLYLYHEEAKADKLINTINIKSTLKTKSVHNILDFLDFQTEVMKFKQLKHMKIISYIIDRAQNINQRFII